MWPHTHVSTHSKGTVALYWNWIGVELCSLLEEECNCTCRRAVERIGELSSPCWTLPSFQPKRKKGTLYTHTHTENKVYNHPTHIHTCAESFTLQGDEEWWECKQMPRQSSIYSGLSTWCVCCTEKTVQRWKLYWTHFKRITSKEKSSRSL